MARSIINDMLQMLIYQQLLGPIFGGISSRLGGGTFRAGLSSFGGGRARGGPVAAGTMYEVNEEVPELLTMGNRQFLMMGQQGGHVAPLDDAKGGTMAAPEVNLRVMNVLDPKLVEQWAASPAGERIIMNIISRNQGLA
jgi:hypothetical protein